MLKDKVFSELRRIVNELGLEDVISVKDCVNKMADFMVYKSNDGIEMFAIDGYPLFPFYSINNVLYDDREATMHYSSEELHFRVLFELWNGYLFVYEMGDQGDSWLLKTNTGDWITEDEEEIENIKNELKYYNAKFMKKEVVKSLIWEIIPELDHSCKSIPLEESKTIEEAVWEYIDETPEDVEMPLFFAHQILYGKMYDDDNKIVVDITRIMQHIKNKGLKDNLMLYIRDEWLDEEGEIYLPDAFRKEMVMAIKYLK